jgi:prophage tail gpP-like protein
VTSVDTGRVEVFATPPPGKGNQLGERLTAWKSVRIARRLDALAGEFALSLAPERPTKLSRGWKVEIALDGTLALSGYVDSLQVSEGEGGAQIAFLGRDISADLVDSTPDPGTPENPAPVEWSNKWLDELLHELVPDGTSLVYDKERLRALGKPISLFRLNQGESYQRAIERACRLRGALPYTLSTGEIAIAPPFGARAHIALEKTSGSSLRTPRTSLVPERGAQLSSLLTWGVNLKHYQLSLNDAERFNTYIVKGQAGGLDVELGPAAWQPEGRSRDLGIRGGRTLVVVAETAAWGADCAARAEWEAAWRAAQSERIVVEVVGWRPRRGDPLWAINQLVKVSINKRSWNGPEPALEALLDSDPSLLPLLGGNLLVNAVQFQSSPAGGGGTTTTLEVVRPDAYVRLPQIEAEPELDLEGGD